jgi:hypothetical protein
MRQKLHRLKALFEIRAGRHPVIFGDLKMAPQLINANTGVMCSNVDHPRHGTAGQVQAMAKENDVAVSVKWDSDAVTESVPFEDISPI